MAGERLGRVAIFCSYAREDAAFRDEIERRLSPLRHQIIDDWNDSRLAPGDRWNDEIRQAMERARVFLFIVTPDLMRSSFVKKVEIPKALEREREGHSRIIPIVARPTNWGDSALRQFQALPDNAKAISTFGDEDDAYENIVAGISSVCKEIVDWENPYKRASVGDWTHSEMTAVTNGNSITGETVVQLTAKSASVAEAYTETMAGVEWKEVTFTIDLTRPLEAGLGAYMKTLGAPMPPNVELSLEPGEHGREILSIGGERYETVWESRRVVLAQRGERLVGIAKSWRCMDVPLDGIVKGESKFSGMEQYSVILDYGWGDAEQSAPRLRERTEPQPVFGAGHWHLRMTAMMVSSDFDLILFPNGQLQGTQNLMGITAPLQGQWAFDPQQMVIQLQLLVSIMGVSQQDFIQFQIQGQQGTVLLGADAMGRSFALERVG